MSYSGSHPDLPFEADARRVLTQVRDTFSEIISSLPGTVLTPTDLGRVLQLDRKLSWNIHKSAMAEDPIDAGLHVPVPFSMEKFLQAAQNNNASKELVGRMRKIALDFDQLVEGHAGDRASFDSMIDAVSTSSNSGGNNLVHKRAAFRANRHIRGIQAQTRFKSIILQPSEDSNWLDSVIISGFVNLQRIHPDAPLTISRGWYQKDDKGKANKLPIRPLNNADLPENELPLIPEFCSQPLPKINTSHSSNRINSHIQTNGIGRKGAITYTEGSYTPRSLPRYQQATNKHGHLLELLQTPSEVLILDLLMRSDTYPKATPQVSVYREAFYGPIPEPHAHNTLPHKEQVLYFGKGSSVLDTPDHPDSVAIAQYAFDQLGWDGDRFDVWRCRIEYPVTPSTIVIRFELPKSP